MEFGRYLAFFFDSYPVKNYPQRVGTIIAFGDSLTVGVGASLPENGYVNILSGRFGVPITNSGISGNTTNDGLVRLESDVLSKHPSVVILLLGANDYLRKIPEDETFTNLRTMIDRIQADGAVVLLVGVRGGLFHDKFDDRFSDLARESGCLFVPNVLDGVIGDVKYSSDDGIHPNDQGYLKMADKIAPELASLLTTKQN